MIERYRREIVQKIFTDESKFDAYLKMEIHTLEAWSNLGKIPKSDVDKIREKATFSVERIKEIEQETRHDIVAFTRNVSESLGVEKKWVHYGLTSTDVVDTANGYILKQANEILWNDLEEFQKVQDMLAKKYHPPYRLFNGITNPMAGIIKCDICFSYMRRIIKINIFYSITCSFFIF